MPSVARRRFYHVSPGRGRSHTDCLHATLPLTLSAHPVHRVITEPACVARANRAEYATNSFTVALPTGEMGLGMAEGDDKTEGWPPPPLVEQGEASPPQHAQHPRPPTSSHGADEPERFGASSVTLFVREPGRTASRVLVSALSVEPVLVRLRATTEVALDEKGPFEPFAHGVACDVTLRARLAEGLRLPGTLAFAKLRPLLFVGLVPLLMLAELDREMAAAGLRGARVRLALGLAFAVLLAVDFARKVPRHPGTSAAILFWVAARYAHLLAVTCGRTEMVGFFAPVLATAVALTLLARAPRGNRLTEEILDKLGVDPEEVLRVRLGEMPKPHVVAAAIVAAVGLPVLLFVLRKLDGSIWTTGLGLLVYGAVVPELIERFVERGRPIRARFRPTRVLFAMGVGFALTMGLVSSAQRSFDAGIYLQRCTHPAEFERSGKQLLLAETREVAKGIAQAKDALPVLLMTVLAVPLAEERLYRGMLQRILTRRYGERLGLVYSALCFGASHLVVYRVAAYQAALLGFGFGAAYGQAGLVASFLAHALWNAHLLL